MTLKAFLEKMIKITKLTRSLFWVFLFFLVVLIISLVIVIVNSSLTAFKIVSYSSIGLMFVVGVINFFLSKNLEKKNNMISLSSFKVLEDIEAEESSNSTYEIESEYMENDMLCYVLKNGARVSSVMVEKKDENKVTLYDRGSLKKDEKVLLIHVFLNDECLVQSLMNKKICVTDTSKLYM